MRVITGTCRACRLLEPEGMDIRPTAGAVKEALFNIIQFDIEGRRVLDLFAGSGALALEALSRGAECAALADRDREAAVCIRRNVEKLRFAEAARLYAADWRQAVSQMQAEGRRFDLVFLDPPYRLPVLEECCAALADAALLEADALMVLEHRLDTPPAPDARFALWKDRAYGDTAIHFFHYRGGAL